MEKSLNEYIDHTLLKPFAGEENIKALCAQAANFHFASVCVNPCYVSLAGKLLAGSEVRVCTVIGFPLGAGTTEIKAAEVKDAKANGCDEFDMVINIGALKDGRYDDVRSDIKAVVDAADGNCVKVIIETGMLTDEEKAIATKLSCEAGAAFVKTCTGFNDGVATVHDVLLMKANCTNGVQVKASSGIRGYADAKALIMAGAERLGTSAGVKIIAESKES